jgi:hypothetical protein
LIPTACRVLPGNHHPFTGDSCSLPGFLFRLVSPSGRQVNDPSRVARDGRLLSSDNDRQYGRTTVDVRERDILRLDSVTGFQLRELIRAYRTGCGSHSGSQLDPAPAKTRIFWRCGPRRSAGATWSGRLWPGSARPRGGSSAWRGGWTGSPSAPGRSGPVSRRVGSRLERARRHSVGIVGIAQVPGFVGGVEACGGDAGRVADVVQSGSGFQQIGVPAEGCASTGSSSSIPQSEDACLPGQ